MSEKFPAFQFYPGDWRSDTAVLSMSRHDRSVWWDLVCMMHDSPERGVLLLPNGRPMQASDLCGNLGLSLTQTKKSLAAILDSGTGSKRESDGAIYNRRMVKDEAKRLADKKSGQTGGNPALCENYNEPGFIYLIQHPAGKVKIGIAKNPTNRLYKLRYQLNEPGLSMIGLKSSADMGRDEKALHAEFSDWRAGGEWFSFPEKVLYNLLLRMNKGKNQGEDILPDKGKDESPGNGNQRASSSPSPSSSPSGKGNINSPSPVDFSGKSKPSGGISSGNGHGPGERGGAKHDRRHWCEGCAVPHEWQCEREDCFMTRGVSCPEFMKAYNERHAVKS